MYRLYISRKRDSYGVRPVNNITKLYLALISCRDINQPAL